MGELSLGCSGWNYPDNADKGGWTGVFYPDKDTKRLRYYTQFFNTAEMDSTFYEKFYSYMTKGTFIGMSRATPEKCMNQNKDIQLSRIVMQFQRLLKCCRGTRI